MNTNDQIRTVVFDVDGTLFDTLPTLAALLSLLQPVAAQTRRPQVDLQCDLSGFVSGQTLVVDGGHIMY